MLGPKTQPWAHDSFGDAVENEFHRIGCEGIGVVYVRSALEEHIEARRHGQIERPAPGIERGVCGGMDIVVVRRPETSKQVRVPAFRLVGVVGARSHGGPCRSQIGAGEAGVREAPAQRDGRWFVRLVQQIRIVEEQLPLKRPCPVLRPRHAGQQPIVFVVFGPPVYGKRVEHERIEEFERKSGGWPRPDGGFHQRNRHVSGGAPVEAMGGQVASYAAGPDAIRSGGSGEPSIAGHAVEFAHDASEGKPISTDTHINPIEIHRILAHEERGFSIWAPVLRQSPGVDRHIAGAESDVCLFVARDKPVGGFECVGVVPVIGIEAYAALRYQRPVLQKHADSRLRVYMQPGDLQGDIAVRRRTQRIEALCRGSPYAWLNDGAYLRAAAVSRGPIFLVQSLGPAPGRLRKLFGLERFQCGSDLAAGIGQRCRMQRRQVSPGLQAMDIVIGPVIKRYRPVGAWIGMLCRDGLYAREPRPEEQDECRRKKRAA